MDIHNLYALIGFMLAAYAVIGNDSAQTLGTFIASQSRIVKWYWLWFAAASLLAATLTYSWVAYDGDISFGRLQRIPPVQIQWYHAAAPLALLALTRVGIPVSTTFLVLSTFASTVLLQDMLLKSFIGYGLAVVCAYLIWLVLSRFINEKFNTVKKEHRTHWRIAQWVSTGLLWFTWLAHDMANIAVFLPRQLPLWMLIGAIATLCGWLAYIFKTQGGKIQRIIVEKTGSRFIRSATIIDIVYASILFIFKEMHNVPISTTWVFVGVLCGREFAIATTHANYKLGNVFPLVGRDFLKMMVGLAVSIAIVLAVHCGTGGIAAPPAPSAEAIAP